MLQQDTNLDIHNIQKQPPEMLYVKGVLRNFHKTCRKHYYFIKKETLTQVFSCKFCEISKNTFFTGHLWTTASEHTHKL